MRHLARLALIVPAVMPWAAPAAAQDSHYWTYGYGPIGQLTEGTLVGRRERPVRDLLQPGGAARSSTSRAS